MKYLHILLEGLRMLWDFRDRRWWRRPPFLPLPPRHYVMWRLGTVYGIYPTHKLSEEPKPLLGLLRELWTDRKNVMRFLLWRRKIRRR